MNKKHAHTVEETSARKMDLSKVNNVINVITVASNLLAEHASISSCFGKNMSMENRPINNLPRNISVA